MKTAATLALAVAGAVACGERSSAAPPASSTEVPVPTPAPAPALLDVPPMPAGVWFQLYFRTTGLTYRFADDGRYLLTLPGKPEAQQAPLSRDERGAQVLSTRAMDRIRAAATTAGFFGLPARIEAGLPEGTRLLNGRTYVPTPVAFTIRGDAGPVTVEVTGDPWAPESFGPLGPIYVQADREAFGAWAGE